MKKTRPGKFEEFVLLSAEAIISKTNRAPNASCNWALTKQSELFESLNQTTNRMTRILICILLFNTCVCSGQKKNESTNNNVLLIPVMVESEKVLAGNPYVQYILIKQKESEYLNSPFKEIYQQQLKNIEQFLGMPNAGVEAMELPEMKQDYGNNVITPARQYRVISAIEMIREKARTHRIIIWGEEHHLPQTRSLYKEMIEELWKLGFRYLAAETFTDEVEVAGLSHINYKCGFYTRDPIFADAINRAITLGFKLISYDNHEDERDKAQANAIKYKVFDKDPEAKILILAGRGHVSEEKVTGGWEPMGYWLKIITGLDPFTLYAPTMSERLTPDQEHPMYKYVAANQKLENTSLLVDSTSDSLFGNKPYFDAYAFFPRVKLLHKRPNWLFTALGRQPVAIPGKLRRKKETRLIQAFFVDQKPTDVPADQVIVMGGDTKAKLALYPGKYWCRALYSDGTTSRKFCLTYAFQRYLKKNRMRKPDRAIKSGLKNYPYGK